MNHRISRSTLAALAGSLGCDRSTPPPERGPAPSALPSVGPPGAGPGAPVGASGSRTAGGPATVSALGAFEDAGGRAFVYVERAGEALRGHLVRARANSVSPLRGKMLDGRRFALEVAGAK
jgi:hypothetical protein